MLRQRRQRQQRWERRRHEEQTTTKKKVYKKHQRILKTWQKQIIEQIMFGIKVMQSSGNDPSSRARIHKHTHTHIIYNIYIKSY